LPRSFFCSFGGWWRWRRAGLSAFEKEEGGDLFIRPEEGAYSQLLKKRRRREEGGGGGKRREEREWTNDFFICC